MNKIIALTHVGFSRDRELAAQVAGIDVIVGGDSNTYLSSTDSGAVDSYPVWVEGPDGSRIPVVQAYAYSKFVGELRIVFDDEGDVVEATGDTHLLDASIAPDKDLEARIRELAAPLDALKQRVVGSTSASFRAIETFAGSRMRDGKSRRGRIAGLGARTGNRHRLYDGGGLRASIDSGEITMAEVLTVLPFQNTVATMRLRGTDLIAALENGVSQVEETKGRFPTGCGRTILLDTQQTRALWPHPGGPCRGGRRLEAD